VEQFFYERFPTRDVLHLRFRSDYEVDSQSITKPMHLLRWVTHLSEKTWMNATFIGEFIRKVCG
jgi:hypothetical protein